MNTGFWLQQFFNALQLASFYMPLAVAFALIQGITKRVFLSFGDLAMFGSFAAIYACFDALVRGFGEWSATLGALGLAIMCGAALGLAIQRGIFGRTLTALPQGFMIASVGLSIALQEIMRLQSQSRDVWVPPLFQGEVFYRYEGNFSAVLPFMTTVAIAVSITALVVFLLALKFTRFGRQWQACTQSLELARLCGIDTDKVMGLSFAAGAGLAAVSGWTSAISYGGTNFTIGLMLGFKAMFAAVVGGFGSVRGALAGAVALAVIEVLWSSLFSTTYRDVAVFAIIIVILLLRPEGLAGVQQRRESEAV
jgi:branched-chain amino acid transport system permease protein